MGINELVVLMLVGGFIIACGIKAVVSVINWFRNAF